MIHTANVLPDFRAPDNISPGHRAIYTSFAEIYTAVQRIKAIVVQGLHEQFSAAASAVT
ncbi:MAG: hypothetical protein R2851_01830 [Caldilineaceae bacterium]